MQSQGTDDGMDVSDRESIRDSEGEDLGGSLEELISTGEGAKGLHVSFTRPFLLPPKPPTYLPPVPLLGPEPSNGRDVWTKGRAQALSPSRPKV